MGSNYKYVGNKFPIQDAGKKVTGELIYASDICFPGMLHVKLLLSPIAHGRIKHIDISEAEALSGVVKIFTYFNSSHRKFNRYRTAPGQKLCPEDEYLFTDKVRFIGDRIAAVVARSADIAKKATGMIRVEYEELPVMVTPAQSLIEGACFIHPGGNTLTDCELSFGEKKNNAFKSVIEIESHVTTQRIHHASIETHAYIARYEKDTVTIWTPTQGIYGVRTVVGDLLDMPYNQVRVIKVPMGGSFGGKQEFIIEPVLAYIAKETNSTVKIHYSRREAIIAAMVRAHCDTIFRSTFTYDGVMINLQIDNKFDAGAYAGSSPDQGHAMMKKISRLYRVPYYKHQCKVIYTNTPLAGGMRGWGSPEIITPFEIHMDRVAKALDIDPVQLRLINLVEAGDIDPSTGLSLGNCRAKKCLELGAKAFDWRNKFKAIKPGGRYLTGVGVACAAHKNGLYNGFPDLSTMTIKMNEDGSVNLITSIHDVGCGTIRSMQIIVGEVLDIVPDDIVVTEGDTEITPYDCGSYGSRVTYVSGTAAYKVALSLKEKIIETAALILGMDNGTLELKDNGVGLIGHNKIEITFTDLSRVALMEHSIELITTVSHKSISNPGVYAVNFAEVEVDTKTGIVKIKDFLAVHDIGRIINGGMVEGQVEGGVQMAIGYALYEDLNINAQGMVVNDTFQKYNLINMPDMPKVRTIFIEDGGDDGPFGAKSLGEIAAVPGTAAIVNAVNNALGTELSDLPLSPNKILAALG